MKAFLVSFFLFLTACGSGSSEPLSSSTAMSPENYYALPGLYEVGETLSKTCNKSYLAYTIKFFKINPRSTFMRISTGENVPLFASPKNDYLTGHALPMWNPMCPTFPDCEMFPSPNIFHLRAVPGGATLEFLSECKLFFAKTK